MNPLDGETTFRCKASDAQAEFIRDGIRKAGLDVGYQEEQHGAALVLVLRCRDAEAQTVRDILAAAGLKASLELIL